MAAEGGFEEGFHGEYRELVPNERLVSTEVYEGTPGGDENGTLITITLAGLDQGRRLMTVPIQAPSRDVRDAIVACGMEAGMQDAYDLLEAVAGTLA